MGLLDWCSLLSIKVNKVLGNKKGWPICASLYESKLKGSRVASVAVSVTDFLLRYEKQHCRRSHMLSKIHRKN